MTEQTDDRHDCKYPLQVLGWNREDCDKDRLSRRTLERQNAARLLAERRDDTLEYEKERLSWRRLERQNLALLQARLRDARVRLEAVSGRLEAASPLAVLRNARTRLEAVSARLEAASPLGVLTSSPREPMP